MAKQITVTAYTFEELSDKAKEHAHERWLKHHQNPWSDDNRKSLEEFCNTFPVKADDWSTSSAGGWIRTHCTADGDIEELSGLRLRTYLLNNYYRFLFEPRTHYYTKNANGERRMNSVGTETFTHKSKIIFERASCPFTGYCMDDNLMDPIHAFIAKPDPSTTFAELLQQCADAWVKACVAANEHSESMEFFAEECEANDRLFTEAGSTCASL